MKKGYTFTILFMLTVSIVFTTLLATANLLATDKINTNVEFALQRSILYAMNVQNDGTLAGVQDAYKKNIRELQSADETIPALQDENGKILGYAVPIIGPGLWGTIEGYLGVSADLTQLIGIVFTKQSETPGLGARIDEEVYKKQFRGMSVSPGAVLKLKAGTDGEVDAVTGATFTSRSVVDMINKALANDLKRLEGLK